MKRGALNCQQHMKRVENEDEKMGTLCKDCLLDQGECGENKLDCKEKSDLYFELYNKTIGNVTGG